MTNRTKWFLLGFVGAICFGSGLSLAIEAGFWRYDGKVFWKWFIGGTSGIGLALAGVVLLIKAGALEEKR